MIVRVLAPGMLTTVQDAGRHGWRHLGVAQCGALDPGAAALANRLVGNAGDEAVLELTLHGPTLQFDGPVRLAICGGRVRATYQSTSGTAFNVAGGRPVELPAGVLRLGMLHAGARAWLAFAGGVDAPVVLGSRCTDLRGGFGGIGGRALRTGDEVALRAAPVITCEQPRMPTWWIDPDADERGMPIRYVPAPNAGGLRLDRRPWRISSHSNRQGVRLEGASFEGTREEQVSAPVAPGTVQLPPNGAPIVLLADAQTVGGYPRLGHVIAADLPRLAQLRPGESVRFESCDLQTATRLACAQRARVARISLMIDQQIARGNLG